MCEAIAPVRLVRLVRHHQAAGRADFFVGANLFAVAHRAAFAFGRHLDEHRALEGNFVAIGGAIPSGGAVASVGEIGFFTFVQKQHGLWQIAHLDRGVRALCIRGRDGGARHEKHQL